MPGLRELAERTPEHRERHIDLLRALAIAAVVLGHWLVMVITYDNDQLGGFSALEVLTWAHPVTWLFQVMPVFFIVGGFANAASLTSHQHRGGDTAGWLLERSARLVRPTTVLLLALGGGAVVGRLLGVDPQLVGTAVWLASLPLWFLVVYLGMVFLTPVMYALHRRAGLAVPVLLLVPVTLGDVGRLWYGTETLAWGNFLFAWLAIHQIGFSWYDGRLPVRPQVAVPLLVGGVSALLALTVAGPYPVSMVTVPGAQVQNPSPPSMALVALATAQLGLALLLRDPSKRWLRRTRPWMVVIAVNAVILTMFLWHMSATVLATVALHLAGLLPTPPVGSARWLLWQLPWVAILTLVLAGLVAVFGPVERRGVVEPSAVPRGLPTSLAIALTQPGARIWVVLTGYVAVLLGLLWQAAAGRGDHGPFALPTGALLVFLAGAALLRLGRWVPAPEPGVRVDRSG